LINSEWGVILRGSSPFFYLAIFKFLAIIKIEKRNCNFNLLGKLILARKKKQK